MDYMKWLPSAIVAFFQLLFLVWIPAMRKSITREIESTVKDMLDSHTKETREDIEQHDLILGRLEERYASMSDQVKETKTSVDSLRSEIKLDIGKIENILLNHIINKKDK